MRFLGAVPSSSSQTLQQIPKPDHGAGQVEECQIVPSGLLEASRDGAETLRVVEEDFHSKAQGVPTAVEPRLLLAYGMRMDHGSHAERFHLPANRVRVVSGVRYERFAACVLRDDRFGNGRVMPLSGRELDMERAAFCVDEGVDLRGEATSRVTQCIADDPPFPPAASWCARITEASIMTPSSSASS